MTDLTKPKEAWGTRIGVILAVMGSAVGLGNFLRFPGLAAQYEGGAFMVPYFVALFILGIPVAWSEWAMGRYGGVRGYNSTPGIYRAIWPKNPLAPYFGVLGMLVPVVIYMYYVLIESWCLGYAIFYAAGLMPTGTDKEPYLRLFNDFTGSEANGMLYGGVGSWALLLLVVCFALNFLLIYRGLSKGIELFCKIAMPALIICAIIVLIRVLTLPNVSYGLGFMWNPHGGDKTFLEQLANPKMWLDAAGQIFFSLSVGFGVIITYASYLRKDDDVALSSLTAVGGNEFCEVALGGMITIPAAFLFLGSVQVTEASGSSFNLGFKTLPLVFAQMPMGQLVGAVFFFLLFLAAITSSLSMLQPAIALLEEGLGIGRKASVTILGLLTAIGAAFVFYFSQGFVALGTMDFWIGTFGIYVLATLQVIMFGWVLGVDRGMEEINRGAEIRVPSLVGFVLKYVSPVYLLGMFGWWLWDSAPGAVRDVWSNSAAAITVGFILIVAVFFTLLVAQSVRRWRTLEARQQEVQV